MKGPTAEPDHVVEVVLGGGDGLVAPLGRVTPLVEGRDPEKTITGKKRVADGRKNNGGHPNSRKPKSPWLQRAESRAAEERARQELIEVATTADTDQLIALVKQLRTANARDDFAEFARQAWHVVEPATKLEWNWHHQLICNVLQAMFECWFRGRDDQDYVPEIINALFNVAPGSLKSRLLLVFFPAWCWLHAPGMKFICLSVNEDATMRDARASRDVIRSDWYQGSFDPQWTLKPVHVDGLVTTSAGLIRAGDVGVGDRVLTHLGRFRRVLAVQGPAVLPTLEVQTKRGRAVRCAPDHPVLTQRGWVLAGELTTNDSLTAVHQIEPCGADGNLQEARLVGYLVGDGRITYRQANVTNSDPELIADVQACVESLGFSHKTKWRPPRSEREVGTNIVTLCHKPGTTCAYCRLKPRRYGALCSTCRVRRNKGQLPGYQREDQTVRRWLEDHRLAGSTSYTKRVPKFVMEGSESLIAEYLAAYWACDGTVIDQRGKVRLDSGTVGNGVTVSATTVSEGLARDHLALLQRLGLAFTLRRQVTKAPTCLRTTRRLQPDGTYVCWVVASSKRDTVAKFLSLVSSRMRHPKQHLAAGVSRTDLDCVLLTDPVVQVNTCAPAACVCLQVEEDASFVFQGVAVHNSDQDAISNYGNTSGGERLSKPSGSQVVGLRSDALLMDDANAPDESADEREKINQVWDESIYTRVNSRKSMRIGIQQRVGQGDWSDHVVLKQGAWSMENVLGWLQVVLPAEFDPDRKFVMPEPLLAALRKRLPSDRIVPEDPRKIPGESVHPARMDNDYLASEKKRWGGTGHFASQFNQQPANAEGNVVLREYFRFFRLARGVRSRVDELALVHPRPKGMGEEVCGDVVVIGERHHRPGTYDFDWVEVSVDCALKATIRGSQWGMLCIGGRGGQRFVLDDRTMRGDILEVLKVLGDMVQFWRADRILVEDKAAGDELMRRMRDAIALGDETFAGAIIEPVKVGNLGKEARLDSALPCLANHMVYLLDGAPWLAAFTDEVCGFPKAQFDDRPDALTQVLNHHIAEEPGGYELPDW